MVNNITSIICYESTTIFTAGKHLTAKIKKVHNTLLSATLMMQTQLQTYLGV